MRPNAKPNILILWKPPQTRFRLQATHDSCQSGKRLGRNKVTSFTRSSGRLIFLVKHHKREEKNRFKKRKEFAVSAHFLQIANSNKIDKILFPRKIYFTTSHISSQPKFPFTKPFTKLLLLYHLADKKIQFILCSSQMIINFGPIERALLHKKRDAGQGGASGLWREL